MEVKYYDEYTDRQQVEIPLKKYLTLFQLALAEYVEYIENELPGISGDYFNLLNDAIESEVMSLGNEKNHDLLIRLRSNSKNYGMHKDLFDNNLFLLISLLDFKENDINDNTYLFEAEKFHSARFIPGYIRLKTLASMIPRDNAIAYMKRYIDESISKKEMQPPDCSKLSDFMEMQIKFNISIQDMCWVNAVISDTKYINLVTKCKIHEVLRDYEDKELMEVIACYSDFAMMKKTNENFVLTRNYTLIGGEQYCDTCYHDTRYCEEIIHPEKSAFEKIYSKYVAIE